MKSSNQLLYEECPALATWERERYKQFVENHQQPAATAAPAQAQQSQTAQQAQQIMTGILQMMQQNPADPNIAQQLPGLAQLLGTWQQELQAQANQQQASAQPAQTQGGAPQAQPA